MKPKGKVLTPFNVTTGFIMFLTFILLVLRFTRGLGSITNLDQQFPWGLWIGFDVMSGVALAAGGFTSGALAHVFHREHYHAIVRPAL